MDITPACEAMKPLGHSWPSIYWWLSLSAADQGAWAAGFGAFAAAVSALWISRRERINRERQADELGRLTAAYLYVPVSRLLNFMGQMLTRIRAVAGVTAGSASKDVEADINWLGSACTQVRQLRERIVMADLAKLRWRVASPLAVVVSEIDQLVDAIEATVLAYRSANESNDPDKDRFDSASRITILEGRVRSISKRLEGFKDYCKRHQVPVAD